MTLVPNLHLIDAKNLLRLSFKSDLWYCSNRGLKYSGLGGSDARPTGDQEAAASNPAEAGNILSWRLIVTFFTVILSLPLIQEGQLSVSCKRYWLTT